MVTGCQEMEPDVFESAADDPDRVEQAKVEMQQVRQLQGLFRDCKFFLGREVPRECFTFLIRYGCHWGWWGWGVQQVRLLQGLFRDCKFFLGREVPRECFTFLIRYGWHTPQ